MPTRDHAPAGAPCWVDLTSSDPDRALDFYRALLGWTADDPVAEFGGYRNLRSAGAPVGGLMAAQPGAARDVWTVYLATDDVRKTVEAAQAEGGRVFVEPMPVGDLGVMAVLADPDGATVGAWQPGTFAGTTLFAEPGAPGWFELQTREYERSVAFYRDVFAWDARTMSDTPDRYTVQWTGDEQVAGILDASALLSPGAPAAWSVYFVVENTDQALARLVELGGSVLLPAEDTPYGRLATAADPLGAAFKLVDAHPAGTG